MPWLGDTNVFLRLVRRDDPQHDLARAAVRALWAQRERLCITSQILGEFWNVCTRPVEARGGLGLTLDETDRLVRLMERRCTFLPDNLAVHVEWRRLLLAHQVRGVQVHDARIVAAMLTHGVTHLLTFNVNDFQRYPAIQVVHPVDVP